MTILERLIFINFFKKRSFLVFFLLFSHMLISYSSQQQKIQDNSLKNIKEFNDNSKDYITEADAIKSGLRRA